MPKHLLAAICWLAALLSWTGPLLSQPLPSEALGAARELVVTMRTADQIKAIMPLIIQQVKPAIVQGRPEVDRAYDQIAPVMMDTMNRRLAEFVDAVAAIYARNFTAAELKLMTAFYHEPVGQKLIRLLPEITQQSMALGQSFGQAAAGDVQRRMIEELRKRGHNI